MAGMPRQPPPEPHASGKMAEQDAQGALSAVMHREGIEEGLAEGRSDELVPGKITANELAC